MAADLVVGVDLGTTALKAGLFDLEGGALGMAEVAYPISRPRPGFAEQDAEAWYSALLDALAELDRSAGDGETAAIGICGQVNTHVFVGESGDALAPAILWQDQRCARIARELSELATAKARPRATAASFDASSLVCRAEWLRRERPDLWEKTHYVLSPKDFLTSRLCHRRPPVTDPISPIGLVDPETREYDADVLGLVDGLAERMPGLEAMDAPIGVVAPAEVPLLEGATVVTGTMDAWANLYGSGVVRHGDAMEVAGTSEILGLLSRESHPTDGVVTFPPLGGLHLHAGPTQAGGAALAWFAQLWDVPIAEVLDRAAEAPAGSGGLIFLPHLLGERAPLWDSDVRGAFIGLSSDHELAHLSRAVLEGVAYSARHLLEELERAAGVKAEALNASGGGSRSDLWCQIKADVMQRPICRVRVLHSGCLGAALMAASGARLVDSLEEAAERSVCIERRFEPSADAQAHDDLYPLYRGIYVSLRTTHAALAAVRQRWTATAT